MGQGARGCRPATRREPRGWQARWLELNAELVRLQASHPLIDAVVDEVDGRRIRIGDRWLDDFASCNYLGFDLDPEIIEGIPAYLHRWGTHPSWSRMLASPVLYERIEAELRELLGAEDVLALPTLTHISGSVIPALAAGGTILVDARAHKTVYDGCLVARGQGATLHRYAHDDAEDLERQLRVAGPGPRLVCLDGINSMTGNPPDLATLTRLARPTSCAPTAAAATGSCATSARATTASCSRVGSPRPTPRCSPSSPAPPGSRRCSRSPRRHTCTPGPRRSPRWPRCSSACRSTPSGATRSAPTCTPSAAACSTAWPSSA